jgi:hypothetical protein
LKSLKNQINEEFSLYSKFQMMTRTSSTLLPIVFVLFLLAGFLPEAMGQGALGSAMGLAGMGIQAMAGGGGWQILGFLFCRKSYVN